MSIAVPLDGSGPYEAPHRFGETFQFARPVADSTMPIDALVETSGTQLFEQYIDYRDQVAALPKVEGRRLEQIQHQVGMFLADEGLLSDKNYDTYDRERIAEKWGALASFLKEVAPEVDPVEYEATEAYRRAAFTMYEETPETGIHPDADASFAFLVPIRMDSEHPDYGDEVNSVIPLFRYIPKTMRGKMVVGLPPSIIDRYHQSEDGKRGYLIFTPVYGDEAIDLRKSAKWEFAKEVLKGNELPSPSRIKRFGKRIMLAAKDRASDRINDAANFAHRRLGADIQGLGAVLPGLANFGRSIEDPEIIPTTGHRGTIKLIQDTLRSVQEQKIGRAKAAKVISVLGGGSIGFSIADVLAYDHLRDPEHTLMIYDKDPAKLERVRKHLAQFSLAGTVKVAETVGDMLEQSDVVVAAITSTLNLDKVKKADGSRPDLRGLTYIDDSQPGSLTAEDAKKHGVNLVWVVGRQYNGTSELKRTLFDYGTMADLRDVFGCEAEAASIAAYARELRAAGELSEDEVLAEVRRYAMRKPVMPGDVPRIGELFDRFHVGAAPLQAFGKLLQPAND